MRYDYDNVEYDEDVQIRSDVCDHEYQLFVDVEEEALEFEEKLDMKRSVRKGRTTT